MVDYIEGPPSVVALQILDVLQHERRWFVVVENVGDGEEQVPLLFVVEPVFSAEAVLLGNTSEAERLTRKPTAQDIVFWNICDGNGMNIPVRLLAEVRGVSDLREFIPIRREHAFGADLLEGIAKASNATEKVYEFERSCGAGS